MRRYKILLASFLVLIIALASYGLFFYEQSQVVSFNLGDELNVKVYQKIGRQDFDYDPSAKPVASFSRSTSANLEKGEYVAVLNNADEYAESHYSFSLKNDPVSITINPSFSKSKLNSILEKEMTTIHRVIKDAYPDIENYYSVVYENLYGHGEWFGQALKPKQADLDMVRIILKKESGAWKLAVNNPDLIISQVQYPEIPLEVLSDINNYP